MVNANLPSRMNDAGTVVYWFAWSQHHELGSTMTQLASGWNDTIRPLQERTRQFYIERALKKRAQLKRVEPAIAPTPSIIEAEESPADLPFNQWKIMTSPAGLHLLSKVTAIVLDYEAKQRDKQTQRNAKDGVRKKLRPEREQERVHYAQLIHAVVANLVTQHLIHKGTTLPVRKGVRVSRSKRVLLGKKSFRYNAPFMGKRMCRVLDSLEATDLIVQDIPKPSGKNRLVVQEQTVIHPSGRFLTLLYGAMIHDLMRDVGNAQPTATADTEEIIMLKSIATAYTDDPACLVNYKDDEVSNGYRNLTHQFNRWMQQTNITILDPETPSSSTGVLIDTRNRTMKRVFNRGRWDSLGRYYGDTWWTPLSKVERFERLRLNGERVVELDFASMLVRLAYSHVGAEPPEGDQYILPGFERSRAAVKRIFCARLFDRPGRPRKKLPKGTKALFHPEELRPVEDVSRHSLHGTQH